MMSSQEANAASSMFTLTALPGMKLGIHVEQNGFVTKVNPNSIFKNYLSNQKKYQIMDVNGIILVDKTTQEIRTILSAFPTKEPRKFTVRCIQEGPNKTNNASKEPRKSFTSFNLLPSYSQTTSNSNVKRSTTRTGYVDDGSSDSDESSIDNGKAFFQAESGKPEPMAPMENNRDNKYFQSPCDPLNSISAMDADDKKSQDDQRNVSGMNMKVTTSEKGPSMMKMTDDDVNFRKKSCTFSQDIESKHEDDTQQRRGRQENGVILAVVGSTPPKESMIKRLSSCTDTGTGYVESTSRSSAQEMSTLGSSQRFNSCTDNGTRYVGSTCRSGSQELTQFGNHTREALQQTIGSVRMSTGNGVQYLKTTYNNASQRAMDGVNNIVGDPPEGQLLLCENGLQYVALGANKCEDGMVYLSNNCKDNSQQFDDDFVYLTNPCNSMRCGDKEFIEGSTTTAQSSSMALAAMYVGGEDDSTDERLSTECVTTKNGDIDDIENGMKPLSFMDGIKCLGACNSTSNAIDRIVETAIGDDEEYQKQKNMIGMWPTIRQNKRKGPPTVVRLNMAGEFEYDENEGKQVSRYSRDDDDDSSKNTAETNHDSSNVSRSSNEERVVALADFDDASIGTTGVRRRIARPAIVMANIVIILAVIGAVVIFFTVGIRRTTQNN